MTLPLADRRAQFLLESEQITVLKREVDSLKDAPLRIRRLGLPLAVATWSKEGRDALVEMLARWLFNKWEMLSGYSVPQTAPAMLQLLVRIERDSPVLRSALEAEAEEVLQMAKILSAAIAGDTGDQDG